MASFKTHLSCGSALGVAVGALPCGTFSGDWRYIIGLPVATALAVWFVVGFLFKMFTRHRGMVHSIPAAVLAALMVFLAGMQLQMTE